MAVGHSIDRTGAVKKTPKRARHGGTGSRLHRIWVGMKQRCHNTKCSSYKDYGGRGIVVCGRWRHSFVAFREDMGEPPSVAHQIDRIDNNGGYVPENCRWTTRGIQMRNTRKNRPLTFDGRTQLLIDWARELGIADNTLAVRIARWGLDKALSTPGPCTRISSPLSHRNCRWITFDGQTMTLSQWAETLGIERHTLNIRIKRWGVERAFSVPARDSR